MQTHQNHATITNHGNPYVQNSPAPPPTTAASTLNTVGRKFESAAKKTGNFAENIYTHYRTGPGFVDVTKSRFDQAARFVFDGGNENIFKREFGYVPGEHLRKTHACYLSITGGPLIGTLYVSNKRIGFKSDYPVWSGPGGGPGRWVYYKVVIGVDQILGVNPSFKQGGEKYIEIVTKDGHEFWFMGFISYEKALKHLYEALPPAPLHYSR